MSMRRRSDIVGCQGCGGPAWHWPDASPCMTLAGPWGRHRGRCVVTGPTPGCLTPWCQRRFDGSTILGSPAVCLSTLYQYHAPHKTAACGDRTVRLRSTSSTNCSTAATAARHGWTLSNRFLGRVTSCYTWQPKVLM